jgi:hypothetical protein
VFPRGECNLHSKNRSTRRNLVAEVNQSRSLPRIDVATKLATEGRSFFAEHI